MAETIAASSGHARAIPDHDRWGWARQLLRLACPHAQRTLFADGHDGSNVIDYHRLFLVPSSSTEGSRVVDEATRREVPLARGSITLLPSRRRYRFRFEPGLRLVGFHFRLEAVAGYDVLGDAVELGQRRGEQVETDEAWDALALDGAGRWLAAEGILRLQLGRSVAIDWESLGAAIGAGRIWEPVLAALGAAPAGGAGIAALARRARMSREHFARSFRARFGLSPRAWHLRQLAVRAVERLLGGDDTLGMVAEEFGFCDAFAFSRFVRRQVGMSPTQLREHGPFGMPRRT